MAITIAEVKQFFKDNATDAEVIAYVAELGTTWVKSDSGTEFLQTNDGVRLYQSQVDKKVTEGINTYKEKTVPSLVKEQVEAKVKELMPEETADQKRIRELEESQKKMEKDNKKLHLEKIVIQKLEKLGLSHYLPLLDSLVGEDETETDLRIQMLAESNKVSVDEAVKEKLPSTEPTPTGDELSPDFKNPFTKKHWNVGAQMKIYAEDKEKFARLKAQAEAE